MSILEPVHVFEGLQHFDVSTGAGRRRRFTEIEITAAHATTESPITRTRERSLHLADRFRRKESHAAPG